MSYQVLARKWRPRNFQQMVGQAHVVRALVNALEADRLHHAFLFAGTRGVGKTTVARILAKCLNCEKGVTSEPCGTCSACTEIDEGRYMDLIEVDAASRSKVDETRELMDNVQFSPGRGRYKVYLIDEVHMFSEKSFNALLKTLEEPPPHVKFLLATTDPQKLPVTVLSRCLQFNLKRLPREEIAAQLEKIASEEGVEHEAGAVRLIAAAADGSMRDALSLLDQALAYGGGKLLADDVKAMLGTIDTRHVHTLLEALARDDGPAVMEHVEAMAAEATDFVEALAELVSELQRVAVLQVVPEAAGGDEGFAEGRRRLAELLSPEEVQLYYQMAIMGRRDLPLAADPRGGFEMALLRMLAFRPAAAPASGGQGGGQSGESGNARGSTPASSTRAPRAVEARPVSAERAPEMAAPAPESGVAEPEPPAAPAVERDIRPDAWSEEIEAMGLVGLTRELAANCAVRSVAPGRITLQLAPGHAQLSTPRIKEKLVRALERYCGRRIKVDIEMVSPEAETPALTQRRLCEERHQAAVQAIEGDPMVQAICDAFDTSVEPNLVKPLDS